MGRKKVTRPHIGPRAIAASLASTRPELAPSTYLHFIYLIRLNKVLDKMQEDHARRFGVSSSDMRVLYALWRSDSPRALSPTELLQSLLVTSGAVTKQVDRLLAAGLVERLPDPYNSGGVLVHLTDRGATIANSAFTELASNVIFPNTLTLAESKTLARLCEKLLVDLEPRVSLH